MKQERIKALKLAFWNSHRQDLDESAGEYFTFRPLGDSFSKAACKTKMHKGIHTEMDQKVTIRPEKVLEYLLRLEL